MDAAVAGGAKRAQVVQCGCGAIHIEGGREREDVVKFQNVVAVQPRIFVTGVQVAGIAGCILVKAEKTFAEERAALKLAAHALQPSPQIQIYGGFHR